MNRRIKISVKVIAVMMAFGAFPAFAGSDVAVENTQIKCTDALKGFTVGADLAYNYSKAKHDELVANFNPSGVTGNGMSIGSIEHRRCNIDPSVNVGYTHLYNNWYMGAAGEISFGKKGKKDTAFDSNTGAHTQISGFSGGVKLKGGYFVKDFKAALYGIAGIKWRDVDCQFNINGNSTSKAKLKRPLFVLGLGLEKPVYKKLSVSAEYEYAWRNSNDSADMNVSGGTWNCHMKQRLNDHSFKVGVKYHI